MATAKCQISSLIKLHFGTSGVHRSVQIYSATKPNFSSCRRLQRPGIFQHLAPEVWNPVQGKDLLVWLSRIRERERTFVSDDKDKLPSSRISGRYAASPPTCNDDGLVRLPDTLYVVCGGKSCCPGGALRVYRYLLLDLYCWDKENHEFTARFSRQVELN